MKSKFLLAAVFILALGGFIGYKMWNKPHKDIAKAESFRTLTSNELLNEFKKDEAVANSTFLNQVVTVSGKIKAVNTDKGLTTLQLETEDMMALIICNLDPFSTHERTDFTVGEDISIKGVCSGMLSDVILDRCVIVK